MGTFQEQQTGIRPREKSAVSLALTQTAFFDDDSETETKTMQSTP